MITITRTDSNNPDFKSLTNKLDIELCRIYNTRLEDFEEYNRITDLGTVVLVWFAQTQRRLPADVSKNLMKGLWN